ncbi:unnamed protein product [Absidia cylindrospora]
MSTAIEFVSANEGVAAACVPVEHALVTDLHDEDMVTTSSADSKYATKEKLTELKKEAKDLSIFFTFMDFGETKAKLDMYADKIKTLEKHSTTMDQEAVLPR